MRVPLELLVVLGAVVIVVLALVVDGLVGGGIGTATALGVGLGYAWATLDRRQDEGARRR